MWSHLPTIFNQRFALRIAGLLTLCVALITTLFFGDISRATTGINQTIAFQGRLQYADGGVVADGHYNMQFKIYQDGNGQTAGNSGGTLKWTENYVNNGGTSGVDVKNGYFSVNLGSVNPFGSSVDWNQDTLWLSMNVAGSASACTTFGTAPCTADGEMTPMQRLTASPYALNSGALNGKTASNFVQLAQGVQNDASTNTSSIFINKTGSGNLLQLQRASTDVLTIDNYGDLYFGNDDDHVLSMAPAATGDSHNFWLQGGEGSASGGSGGSFVLQGGNGTGSSGNGGGVSIEAGTGSGSGSNGTIQIGTTNASAISIGSSSSAITQNIIIGTNNTAGSTTNVTIGAGGSATGGTTTIQSKGDTTIKTNGTTRATFSGSGNTLYLGNADTNGQATTASGFTIQGTSSTGNNVQGGSLALQAGSATNGNANGGNLTLSGGTGAGTGANGLVVISTPTFSTATSDANCYTSGALVANNCTITAASINNSSAILVGFNATGKTASVPDPTITTAGRIIYITAANGSTDFTLSLNGGGTGNLTSMRQNTTATLIWNGSDWTVAGASNSTTLQSAYDNTLQSAGGAELVVSKTSNTNGLTIRDSTTNSVNGTLLQVQSKTSANLFSVSSNVSDYASDNGAEADDGAGGFPASTWAAKDGNATVTRNTTTSDNSIATGKASVKIVTTATAGTGVTNQIVDPTAGTAVALNANTLYNVSFSARLPAGSASFNDLRVLYQYDASNTVACTSGQSVAQTSWTKVNCTFTTPASSILSSNKIRIEQATGVARTFFVDNLSVTIAASQNYASDPGVDSALGTNWVKAGSAGASVTRSTTNGYDKSDSVQLTTTAASGDGVANKLAVSPIPSNNYRVSVQVQTQTSALTNFTIAYTYDNFNLTNCVDYNTQAVAASTTAWTKITCIIQVPSNAPTNPIIVLTQGDTTARSDLFVDAISVTIANSTTPNVQVGSGTSGGPVTLLTLDSAASAPIEADNSSLFGSMYYDTTQGKIQCYQASGWGSCGAAPDNIITISPEYTNAVMHGTGVGTMTSDFCSDSLNINNGTSGQPSICGAGQTYNFYKWTSPQSAANPQTYSIYVTYQLPSTFKSFSSGSTSIMARTDNGSNGGSAKVQYTVYRNTGSSLTPCNSSPVVVSQNTQTAWQPGTATGTADPSTCGFVAGNSIVFKIDMTASANAIAYVTNLGFTFSNK